MQGVLKWGLRILGMVLVGIYVVAVYQEQSYDNWGAFHSLIKPEESMDPLIAQPVVPIVIRAGKELSSSPSSGNLRLSSEFLSFCLIRKRHAILQWNGSSWMVEDLRSENKTFLHGQEVLAPAPIQNGNILRIGTIELMLSQ